MIFDRLDQWKNYAGLGYGITEALEYLSKTDFSKVPNGKYPIDGERIFAVVMQYPTKPMAEAKWEKHNRYLDVQYMAAGNEQIGYCALEESLPVEEPYNAEKDVAFYKCSGVWLPVDAGMFAIFAPYEVHAPCLVPAGTEQSSVVTKVVVKCRWDE